MSSLYASPPSEGLHHPTTTTPSTQQGLLELDFPWLTTAPFSPLDLPTTTCINTATPGGHQEGGALLPDTSNSLLDLLEETADPGTRDHLADLFDFWSPARLAPTYHPQQALPAPGGPPVTGYSSHHQGAAAVSPSTSGSMTSSPEPCRLSLASSGYHSNSLSSPPALEDLEGAKTPSPGADPMQGEESSVYLTPPPSVKLEQLEQIGHAHSRPGSTHSDAGSTHWSPASSPVSVPAEVTAPVVVKAEPAKPVPAKSEPANCADAKTAKKPAATYIEMVARALLTVPSHKLILADIYADILQRYPYYETAPSTWRNAVRHNLCVNDCFIKAGRSNSGRGFFWAIHPACADMFSKGDFRRVQARRLAQQMNNAKAAAAAAVVTASSAHHITASHQPTRLTAVTMPGYAHQAPPPSLVATPTASYQAPPYGNHAYSRYYTGSHAPQLATTYQYYPQQVYTSSAPSCQSLYATPLYR